MSVSKRNGIWHYDFTDERGERRRGSTRVRDKKAAEQVEAEMRRRAALGASLEPDPTVRQAFAIWFKARVAGKKSQAETARRIEIVLSYLDPDMAITQLRTPHIEAAIQARRVQPAERRVKAGEVRAVEPATINRDMCDHTLRPMLRYWRRVKELRVVDPVWKDLRLQEPPPRARERTPEEIEAWRSALQEHYRPLMDFYLVYGVRLSEAFFPPEAYNPSTGRVTLRARKAGDDHGITLLPEHRPAMAARVGRAKRAGLSTVWFREVKRGLAPISKQSFARASAIARDKAGITDARAVHDFRHHAGTTTLRASGSLPTVKKLLGHASIVSTARYAHASDGDVLEALRLATATKPKKTTRKKRKVSGLDE